jgi:hypothetical protein
MKPQPDKKKSSYQQELERRSNDLLRVFNPKNEDHIVEWDRKNGTKLFRVPAKTEAVLPRYIAEKFIKEMYNKMIIEEATEAITKENKRRIKVGMAELDKTQKTGEQEQFESRFYLGNNEKSRQIIALLYMGLETEFGVDRTYQPEAEKMTTAQSFGESLAEVQQEKDSGIKRTKDKSNQFKCDYPNCDFVIDTSIGLMNHKRTHRKEVEKKEKADENLDEKKKEAVQQVSQ